ncbi:hypothetical protein PPYR_00720 [Photinus pyralis]|uniref:Uncharacterized protein n=1 Tax=Photinus pyralis TaxID=7054 RepID=A0A5N4B2X4_PHOPY|nr:hypothetical protein PPYR_00720 [Photinus pyralis]
MEMNTEYKRFKYFSRSSAFIEPSDHVIGHSLVLLEKNGDNVLLPHENVSKVFSMAKMFKNILELPSVLQDTKHYLTKLQNSKVFSNFTQGKHWKSKLTDKFTLPIFLYYDDYELGNALGSRAGTNKLGAVYCTIPCLPQYFYSLKSIFLVSLFYTNDKRLGYKHIFKPIVDELNSLESEGIVVNYGNKEEKVYFQLALLLGDNLALHTMLGFTESFSATYRCRFCKIPKNVSYTACCSDDTIKRTIQNYESDLQLNDLSQTGIKENSIWNDIKNFHVVENFAVDIMHDLLEGVCMYDMTIILNKLILEYQLFSLTTLNNRILGFNTFGAETANKPPVITLEMLKGKLKFSAAEMLFLSRYLDMNKNIEFQN